MRIRITTRGDIDAIVGMAAKMHAECGYSFLSYDSDKVRSHLERYFENEDGKFIRIADSKNLVAGVLCGAVTAYPFSEAKFAKDLFLFVEPQYRGSLAASMLIESFQHWAIDQGAAEIWLSISSGIHPKRTGKFYERMGLQYAGGIYKRRLW